MNALLLIDLQNDFAEGGALPVPGGLALGPVINRLQPDFDLIVATQDWHPANHGSFAANHPGSQPGQMATLGGLPQRLWPVHCVQGTAGADFLPGLDRTHWAAVFRKGEDPGLDSYSGFFDNGHRRATGLADWLRQHGVDRLHVAGLATDYCVKYTVLDALSLGFAVTVIEDACCGVDLQPGDVRQALEEMTRAGARLTRTAAYKTP